LAGTADHHTLVLSKQRLVAVALHIRRMFNVPTETLATKQREVGNEP